MTDNSAIDRMDGRYGPISFVVALLHILVVVLITWILIPYSILLILPGALIYLAISALIARAPGKIGQAGRGMLIGTLSGPLSLLIFIPVAMIAKAIGPI